MNAPRFTNARGVDGWRKRAVESLSRGRISCYGYRYLPKRHGCAPQVVIDPEEAEVVRQLYRGLVEEQLSCRQLTKRLNEARTSDAVREKPGVARRHGEKHSHQSRVYRSSTVQLSPTRAAQISQSERNADSVAKTGRSYRPAEEWVVE